MATEWYDDYDISTIDRDVNYLYRRVNEIEGHVQTIDEDVKKLSEKEENYNYYVNTSEEELVENEIIACQRAVQKIEAKLSQETNEMTISVYKRYLDDINKEITNLRLWKNGDKTVEISALNTRKKLQEEKIKIGEKNYYNDFEQVETSVSNIRTMTEKEKTNKNATQASLKAGLSSTLKSSIFTAAGGAGIGALIAAAGQTNIARGAGYGALGGIAVGAIIGLVNGIREMKNYKKAERDYRESALYLKDRGLIGVQDLEVEKGMSL